MKKMTALKSLSTGDKIKQNAQGLVEFALVIPVLLLVVLGLIELGRMLFIFAAVATSSSEAVRYGSAVDDSRGSPQFADCSGIQDAATGIGSLVNLTNVNISYDQGPGGAVISTDCSTLDTDLIVGGRDRINVDVEALYQPIIPITNFPGFTIRADGVRTIVKDIQLGEGGSPGGAGSGGTLPQVCFTSSTFTTTEKRGTISLTVEMDKTIAVDVIVPFNFSGTATLGDDYTTSASPPSTSSYLVIPAGSTSGSIAITFIDDGVLEGDETISVGIDTPTNATLCSPNVYIITLGDPALVSFTLADQSRNEPGTMTAVITLDKIIDQDVTAPFTIGGSATQGSGADFTLTASPVVINAGSLTADVVIDVKDDSLDEYDETVILSLEPPTNADLHHTNPIVHTATILDDDPPPSIFFDPDTQSAAEDVGDLTTSIKIDAVSGKDVQADFSASGTATENVDYTLSTYSVTIPAGSTSADITITVTDDLPTGEPDETVMLSFDTVTNATSVGNYSLTITEVAVQPVVYFDPVDTWTVRAQLTNAWGFDVTVPFTLSGTATHNVDYTITATPVTIPAGSTHADITVSPIDDLLDEDDETVIITMGTPTNAIKGTPDTHTTTIPDNDPPPLASFSPNLHEDDEDNLGIVTFQAQLDTASGKEVSIPFSLGGTAFKGSYNDYTITSSPVIIPAGDTFAEISITVNEESDPENDETVVVTMQEPINATLAPYPDYVFTLTIRDDDACTFILVEPSLVGPTVTWQITNTTDAMITLTDLSISWDETGGQSLDSVIMNGNPIVTQIDNEQPTVVPSSGDGNFSGSESLRQIPAGGTATIVFNFSLNATSGYPIDLTFNDDSTWCAVSDTY